MVRLTAQQEMEALSGSFETLSARPALIESNT